MSRALAVGRDVRQDRGTVLAGTRATKVCDAATFWATAAAVCAMRFDRVERVEIVEAVHRSALRRRRAGPTRPDRRNRGSPPGSTSAASRSSSRPGAAGPAGVGEQHALWRFPTRGQTGERERDVRAVGLGVVERDRERAALAPFRTGVQATVPVVSSRSGTVASPPAPAQAAVATTSATARPARRRRSETVDRPCRHPRLGAVFRLSAHADPAFLAEMLYEAVNWHDDGAEERPADGRGARPIRRTRATSTTGAGRATSRCLRSIARDEPVGAAWLRRFTAAEPGYGYVADDVPELSIGVFPEFRGQKVGTLLMGSIIARAERDHVRGDQPQRESRESCETPVRARAVSRSWASPADSAHHAPRTHLIPALRFRIRWPGFVIAGLGYRGGMQPDARRAAGYAQAPETGGPAPPAVRGPALERRGAPRRRAAASGSTRRGSS